VRESTVQSAIIKWLESQGAWVVKTIQVNKRGCPDILACLNGRFVAIEVKAPGKLSTVTPIQQYQIVHIIEAGGIAIAADSLDAVKKYLHEVLHAV
jgi:Holliday junction resolvase